MSSIKGKVEVIEINCEQVLINECGEKTKLSDVCFDGVKLSRFDGISDGTYLDTINIVGGIEESFEVVPTVGDPGTYNLVDNNKTYLWEAHFCLDQETSFTVTSASDDYSFLEINCDLVIDNGGFHGIIAVTETVVLSKGEHTIRYYFGQGGGGGSTSITGLEDVEFKGCKEAKKPPGEIVGATAEGSAWNNLNGSVADQSSTDIKFTSGGADRFIIENDGCVTAPNYGDNTKNNGTPVSVWMPDTNGVIRERPITDGNPRMAQSVWGGNWLWGGWTTVATANTGIIDRGWVTAATITAPQVYAGFNGTNMDLSFAGHFGRTIHYGRECRIRTILGWRVLINGGVVGTRDLYDEYHDFRTNLGNETNLDYKQRHGCNNWYWVRNNVPPGASVEVQYRMRYQLQGAQTNAYARIIMCYGREINFTFVPARGVLI